MKKHVFAIAGVLWILSFILVGCAAEAANTTNSSQDTKDLSQQLLQLSAGEYEPLKLFVEESIDDASPELAGAMVRALIDAAEKELAPANAYIYSEESRNIQDAITTAMTSDMIADGSSTFCGESKNDLLEAMQDGEIKDHIAAWLVSGLGLSNGEGTYFFVVDYPEYLELYQEYVDDATASFLSIAAAETQKATLVSEVLSVDANELGNRAIAYETFLAEYADFPMKDHVRIYFNAVISKLAYPTVFDRLVDEQGRATTELMVVYERLAERQDCPALQQVAKDMLDFIEAQPDGIIAQGYDTDALSSNASEVVRAAQDKADTLYGALEE